MLKLNFKNLSYYLNRRFKSKNADRASLILSMNNNSVLGKQRMGLQIQTISACNASCYFCPYLESWHKENPGVISEKVYRNIIDQVAPYKITKFCPYLENEPLLDPKIFDRIEYGISKLDYLILELSTNASHLNSKKIEDIVRIFPNVPHEIRISFHGVDKESFETIMGLDFEKCYLNILSLLEMAQKHKLNISILGAGAPVLSKSNAPFWFDKKKYLTFWDNVFNQNSFKNKPNVKFFKYHDRAGSIDRNEVNFSNNYNRKLDNFYCHRINQWFHFLYTGEMILCCMDYHKQTVLGNINNSSLKDIYLSNSYKNFVNQAIGVASSPENFICKKCISPGG